MKISFVLLLASCLDASPKGGKKDSGKDSGLAPKRKREAKNPLATRNTALRACHKIRKGMNEPSASAVTSKKACKCLTGWKKSNNKETGNVECNRVNTKVLRNAKVVKEYETYSEALSRAPSSDNDNKCIIVTGDEKVIDCKGVGFDSKKAKKIIAPADTRVLDWSDNHIKDVHYTWYEGLVDLEKISFRNNFLRTLDPHTFRGSYMMNDIDLSFNQFAALNNSGLFKKNPNLKTVRINNNMIGELKMKVISVLAHLEHFEVQNNRLKKITGGILSRATNLVYADFGNNHIEKIATKAFNENINLKTLYINNNRLQTINKKLFSAQENLLELRLEHNEIHTINKDAMRGLKSVKNIFLQYNKLAELTENQFKGLKALEQINLDHNKLTTIPASVFTNCDNLKYVFIRYNKITSLDASLFNFNPLLKIAFMSHNEMDNIESGLLKEKADLKRLDISENKITNVGDIIDGSQEHLEFVYMSGNTMESANANLIARATALHTVDASKNALSEGDLQFVANAIDNSPLLNMVDLSENQFSNPSFDAKFSGASDIARLKTEIANSQTL